jgi:hypothetical protein
MLPFPQPAVDTKSWLATIDRIASDVVESWGFPAQWVF